MDLSVCRPFMCVCVCVDTDPDFQLHRSLGRLVTRAGTHSGHFLLLEQKARKHFSTAQTALRYTNTWSLRGTPGEKHSRAQKTPGQARLFPHKLENRSVSDSLGLNVMS
ncbi:hypothetical protein QQF64_032023 [Cirrhinus molitorella]|uniref:Uncharacterized protein n=1 Tax=Cirrhinus molitorella TaxID=172907 RepID=A0ABR3MYL4_9TELE